MNLVIDIGNSRVKAGVFADNRLVANITYETFSIKSFELFTKKHTRIKDAIVCTVTDYPAGLIAFLKKNFNLIELSEKTILPFSNNYKTPKTLGKDRLAVIAGAQHLLPGKNALVINAGTCITYDFIDNKGVYQGGSISPGLEMRFKALHTFTGRLPLIEADSTYKELVGKTTKDSILSGVQQGIVKEIEGIVEAYKKRLKGLQIILTGGWHKWLKNQLGSKIISEPYLTLTGLNVILMLCQTQPNRRKK
ncbi:MAG TPA: type III pantothenate kinase [Bacteroidia bacterium]|jgi:type III pantothenate kinase|nr:type III pantothenate kinase [Bacteroidia bacterium]